MSVVGERQQAVGRWAATYARLVTRLRWLVVLGWVVVAGVCLALPTGSRGGSGGVEGFIPADAPAVQAEIREVKKFGSPLLGRVAVVQRNPDGLAPLTQAAAVARAAAVIQRQYDDTGPLLGAIPIPNTFGAFPGSRESDTTIITLLFMPPNIGVAQQVDTARAFVANHYGPDDSVVGVTGTVPALAERGRVLNRSLVSVESATLAAIVLIVAFAFRSLLAPLLALATAGIAILATLIIAQIIAARAGVPIPAELRPLLVALLLGVVTDYVIFYLFGLRRELAAGLPRLAAAERATVMTVPVPPLIRPRTSPTLPDDATAVTRHCPVTHLGALPGEPVGAADGVAGAELAVGGVVAASSPPPALPLPSSLHAAVPSTRTPVSTNRLRSLMILTLRRSPARRIGNLPSGRPADAEDS